MPSSDPSLGTYIKRGRDRDQWRKEAPTKLFKKVIRRSSPYRPFNMLAAQALSSGAEAVTFYDIPSSRGSWSPNTVKVRLALAFRGIPFHTVWIPYPGIAACLQELSIPAGPMKKIPYTLPAIVHSSIQTEHHAMNDSMPILEHLETVFPSSAGYPTLFPHGDRTRIAAQDLEALLWDFDSILPVVMSRIADIMDPASAAYFHRTRTGWFGKNLKEHSTDPQAERALLVQEMRALVEKVFASTQPSPWIEGGEKPTYPDFVLVGFLVWLKAADEEAFQVVVNQEWAKGIKEMYERCLPWLAEPHDAPS